MGFRLVERVFTAVGVAIDLVERIRTEPPHGLNFPVAGSAAGPRQSGEFGVFTEDEVTHSAGREVRAGKPVADVAARRENPGLRVVAHRRAPVARNAQDAGPGLLESNIPQGWEEFAEALLQLPDGRISHLAVPVEARTEVIGNAAAAPTSGEVQALDDLSIQDRLDALDIDPDARHALECIWVGHANAPLNEAALSYALRWTAASGGHWQVSHEASATYRAEGGMNSLSSALAADVRGEIRLGTPVASVTQQDGFAIIETVAGHRIRARRVISTLPINAAEGITFSPTLPDAWQQLSREKVASRASKCGCAPKAACRGSSRTRRRMRPCQCSRSSSMGPILRAKSSPSPLDSVRTPHGSTQPTSPQYRMRWVASASTCRSPTWPRTTGITTPIR
ncbi:hypothetical protein F8O05_10615 [Gulosibacter chungangensis]|uniref:Amine oxidase domain-containing protein n=1 Tax=Gulosibacter chungangensis TaxID=979746 RepID=A0A7J5B9Q1_9MICO|nr:hypothetical protein F8O05_10615 [Gulosibacter chungangensis]